MKVRHSALVVLSLAAALAPVACGEDDAGGNSSGDAGAAGLDGFGGNMSAAGEHGAFAGTRNTGGEHVGIGGAGETPSSGGTHSGAVGSGGEGEPSTGGSGEPGTGGAGNGSTAGGASGGSEGSEGSGGADGVGGSEATTSGGAPGVGGEGGTPSVALGGAAGSEAEGGASFAGAGSGPSSVVVSCENFAVTGAADSEAGAHWTYASVDEGVTYSLEGVLFSPSGAGPFPAVLVSHGGGSNIELYTTKLGKIMVQWGLVVIGTNYTHAPDADDAGNLPDGEGGASEANILRAKKAIDLLTCLGTVDDSKIAAHGQSLGGYVTAQLAGTYPDLLRAASQTAAGVGTGTLPTKPDVAALITTPYQIHHGDADVAVDISAAQALNDILELSGTEHEFYIYAGVAHNPMSDNSVMLGRVHVWYQQHGLLP